MRIPTTALLGLTLALPSLAAMEPAAPARDTGKPAVREHRLDHRHDPFIAQRGPAGAAIASATPGKPAERDGLAQLANHRAGALRFLPARPDHADATRGSAAGIAPAGEARTAGKPAVRDRNGAAAPHRAGPFSFLTGD